MIYIAIATVLIICYLVYDYYISMRSLKASESRIMSILNKAIDNVGFFFATIFSTLWSSNDHDDELHE